MHQSVVHTSQAYSVSFSAGITVFVGLFLVLLVFLNFSYFFSCVSVLEFSFLGFELFLISVFCVTVVVAIIWVYCNSSLGCTIYGAPSKTTSLGG
jgi:hypothetical protein